MPGTNGGSRQGDVTGSIRFSGSSFVVAAGLPKNEQRALEHEIEARGGLVHPFLNAVTDILVVGQIEGNGADAQWAREQVRRGLVYQARWGHLEVVPEEMVRAALEDSQEESS